MSTEAGRRLLVRLSGHPRPYATYSDKSSWGEDVAAIEAEAVAAERERIEKRVIDRMHGGTWLDEAAVLAIVRGEP